MRIVGGDAKGRRLKSPKTPGTRPVIDRVKTALFDVLGARVSGAHFLDLFAGTGAVGLEALSRGAELATFVEMSHQVVAVLRENLRVTGLAERAEVVRGDAFRFLELAAAQGRHYDIIYIAPPQYRQMAARALVQVERLPLTHAGSLAIVQIFPKERVDLDQLALSKFRQVDERRYGSTLLLFYEDCSAEDRQAEVKVPARTESPEAQEPGPIR